MNDSLIQEKGFTHNNRSVRTASDLATALVLKQMLNPRKGRDRDLRALVQEAQSLQKIPDETQASGCRSSALRLDGLSVAALEVELYSTGIIGLGDGYSFQRRELFYFRRYSGKRE